MFSLLLLSVWVTLGLFLWRYATQAANSQRTSERLFIDREPRTELDNRQDLFDRARRWLRSGGYTAPSAVAVFILSSFMAFLSGGALCFFIRGSSLLDSVRSGIQALPGNGAVIFSPILAIAPYFIWLAIAILPLAIVRASQRRRQKAIEEDFPIFLDFLVTLTEAGMGFDEAVGRVVKHFAPSRPLPERFTLFQREVTAGSPRVSALWRLRDDMNVREIRSFVSALVQSSQTGGRIGDILRSQANDALSRRKMRALEWAAGLPVKLLFPMFVCFLPGIWILGLGPVIHKFLETIEPTFRRFGG